MPDCEHGSREKQGADPLAGVLYLANITELADRSDSVFSNANGTTFVNTEQLFEDLTGIDSSLIAAPVWFEDISTFCGKPPPLPEQIGNQAIAFAAAEILQIRWLSNCECLPYPPGSGCEQFGGLGQCPSQAYSFRVTADFNPIGFPTIPYERTITCAFPVLGSISNLREITEPNPPFDTFRYWAIDLTYDDGVNPPVVSIFGVTDSVGESVGNFTNVQILDIQLCEEGGEDNCCPPPSDPAPTYPPIPNVPGLLRFPPPPEEPDLPEVIIIDRECDCAPPPTITLRNVILGAASSAFQLITSSPEEIVYDLLLESTVDTELGTINTIFCDPTSGSTRVPVSMPVITGSAGSTADSINVILDAIALQLKGGCRTTAPTRVEIMDFTATAEESTRTVNVGATVRSVWCVLQGEIPDYIRLYKLGAVPQAKLGNISLVYTEPGANQNAQTAEPGWLWTKYTYYELGAPRLPNRRVRVSLPPGVHVKVFDTGERY